ncbi:hypothetical protein H4720_004471, partial [Salmonella enterica]|nr:hypothetical protein [Salmonella enterica]
AEINGISRSVDCTFNVYAILTSENFVVLSNNAVNDGIESNSVRARVIDGSGDPLSGIKVEFTATNGAIIAPNGTTDANGEVLMKVTSTTKGYATVTAKVGIYTFSDTVNFDELVLTSKVIVDRQLPNNQGVNEVEITARSSSGRYISGTTLKANTTDKYVTFDNGTDIVTGSDGTARYQVKRNANEANVNFTVTSPGAGTTVNASVDFVEIVKLRFLDKNSENVVYPNIAKIVCRIEMYRSSTGERYERNASLNGHMKRYIFDNGSWIEQFTVERPFLASAGLFNIEILTWENDSVNAGVNQTYRSSAMTEGELTLAESAALGGLVDTDTGSGNEYLCSF